ncbi:hypothetical protein [Streptomyces erythrochromogenes]|uniref:hypothetical protein n=1 Tax=Streptomyces erythrochromogenes TaxID=285574 RepID=UPI00368CEE83
MTADSGTDDLITREQAFINARRVLDIARERRDRDRARGVLPPQVEFMLRRIEHKQNPGSAPDGTAVGAVLLHLAQQWSGPEVPHTSLDRLEEATGRGIVELREALVFLAAAEDVELRFGERTTWADPMHVSASAGFEIRPDWHLINHRRPAP